MAALTDDLKLVLPVRGAGSSVTVHAYHMPISRAVFEANYRLLAGTRAALLGKGVAYMMDSGPRIAALALKDEGKRDAAEEGEKGDGGADALLGEIARLTTILAPVEQGWDILPVDVAITRGIIDSEEWSEVLAAIVFFTCTYVLARKADRARVASTAASTLRGSITSSSATEFAASLPTSTTSDVSVSKAESSVPS